jgi:DHA1 family florfenicol/chloramphenicol resistance protein-like MFS transporter
MQRKSIARVLSILSPSIILRAFAMDIFIPCLPSVASEFVVPFSTAQWVLSLYFIGSGAGQLLIGPLADRFGRRKSILGSILLFALSSIACSFANSILVLIAMRLLQGLGACGTAVVTFAIIRDLYEDHAAPKVYSYVNAIISLAPIIAPILGGSILVWSGTWRSTFYFMTAFSAFAFAINYLYLKETNPRLQQEHDLVPLQYLQNYKEIFCNTKFLTYNFCAIACLSGVFLFFSTSSVIMISILGVPADKFGFYFAGNFILYMIGNLLSPKFQTRLGVDKVIRLGLNTTLSGAVLMLLWHWQFGLSIAGLLVPSALLTFGAGLMFGPCMAGAMRSFKHIAGMASAAYGALLYCTSTVIATAVMQFTIRDTLPLALTSISMCTVTILLLRRQGSMRDQSSNAVSNTSS